MEQTKLAEKILFVDDDPNILASFLRQLRRNFAVDTALGGAVGLEMVANQGPYAVVVSDFKMPGMDGVQLLNHLREQAPDTVRILLTGYADVDTSIRAVNEGNIFRLLTKPIDTEGLVRALVAGVKQYRLINAERELLQKTLAGTIRVLTELLSLLNPEALGRSCRIRELVAGIARRMGLPLEWTLDSAAMLCQLGMVMMPPEALQRILSGQELKGEDLQLYDMHPMIAADLVRHIPRLEEVARIITFQDRHYDGSGPPPAATESGEDIPLESRILKVALDYDLLFSQTGNPQEVLQSMRGRKGWYDRKALQALGEHLAQSKMGNVRLVNIKDLTESMVLAEDVLAEDGRVLVPRGYQVTRLLVAHLLNFQKSLGVVEPLKVETQADEGEQTTQDSAEPRP
ncbi:MAG: response regulator [Desulfarculus sp.]|nr:response regulator [Desulfarculus sp.]